MPANSSFAQCVCPCPYCNQQISWVRTVGDAELVRLVALDNDTLLNASLSQRLMYIACMAVGQISGDEIVWKFVDDFEYTGYDEPDEEEPPDFIPEDCPAGNFDDTSDKPSPITNGDVSNFTRLMGKLDKAPKYEDLNGGRAP